jgi:CRP-like cAMP-binding protein
MMTMIHRPTRLSREIIEGAAMQMTAQQSQQHIVAAHPLTQLLECPPETSLQLGRSVRTLQFEEGDAIFRQDAPCAGLYLLVSGNFLRRVERMGTRLTLAPGSPGDLLELAATLGDKRHTYTLIARTRGTALLLPMENLESAFAQYPPLRMHLLEELAREVSRAYSAVWLLRMSKMRRTRVS